MEKNILHGSFEAHLRNSQRPGLDPEKPTIIKKHLPDETKLSEDQQRAESLLGKVKVAVAKTGKHLEESDCTTNYDQFKLLSVNRAVDNRHVTKLIAAIQEKNLLHLNPIVVNRAMEVIDGQHRLSAARRLGQPIYYVVDDQVNQDDIAGMNSVKKTWQLFDYVNFYANKGVLEYVKFMNLCKCYPDYNNSMLLNICSGSGKRSLKNVQNGVLNIDNIDFAPLFISQIDDFKAHFDLSVSSRFIEAFLFIVHSGIEYDHSRMMQKVNTAPYLMVPCANKRGYIKMLESIYNRGVHDKNIVIFLKR